MYKTCCIIKRKQAIIDANRCTKHVELIEWKGPKSGNKVQAGQKAPMRDMKHYKMSHITISRVSEYLSAQGYPINISFLPLNDIFYVKI